MANGVVSKKYVITNKFIGYMMGVMGVIFASAGIVLIATVNALPKSIELLPFYSLPFYMLFIFLIKDFLWFSRILFSYLIVGTLIMIFGSIYFLLHLIEIGHEYLSIGISIFLSLFIISFIWDMIVLTKDNGVEKIFQTYTQRLKKMSEEDRREIIKIDMLEFFKINYHFKSTKFFKVFIVFALPFALLGKGLAYALAIGVGALYQDGHEYIISTFGLAFSLLMAFGFFPITIVFWKLKYPIEKEQ